MLTSLFGDLGPARNSDAKKSSGDADERAPVFAATSIMESVATEVNERGQMVDRHLRDLVIGGGSPAHAIREHFAATRADLDTASSMITLLDPVGVWASSVTCATWSLPVRRPRPSASTSPRHGPISTPPRR